MSAPTTQTVLSELEAKVAGIIEDVEKHRGVRFHLGKRAAAAVGLVDPGIKAGLEAASREQHIDVLRIGSPASHDAAAFGAAGVKMGMIFVRNENGSHNPHEAMCISDFLDGTAVLLQWLINAVRPEPC